MVINGTSQWKMRKLDELTRFLKQYLYKYKRRPLAVPPSFNLLIILLINDYHYFLRKKVERRLEKSDFHKNNFTISKMGAEKRYFY